MRAAAVVTFAIAAALIGVSSALAEVKNSSTVRYYEVPGRSLEELARFVARNPLDFRSTGAIGRTEANFDFTLVATAVGPVCTANDAEIAMHFVITLPRASEAGLKRAERARWREFVGFVRRHEEMHRTIYLQCMESFARSIRGKRSTRGCEALTATARQRFNQALLACEQRHNSLDARDRRTLEKLPIFRSLR